MKVAHAHARAGRPRGDVAPARLCAFRVVRRVFERGAYADRALTAEASAAALSPRDRQLAMQLTYGVVQRAATLDHIIERLAARAVKKLDPEVLVSLRIGLYQLLFLDGIPAHAAVNDSVALVAGGAGGGLVNAVLRRASREADTLLEGLSDTTPAQAAILHSVPVWLAEQWWRELGPEQARALLGHVNAPAESALRVNTLRSTRDAVVGALPVSSTPADGLPEGLVLNGPFDVRSSELWRAGAVMAQSRGSMRVARALSPSAGQRVLDLCAAPGAKTTHIAALIDDRGEVIAVERNARRARALREVCKRMGAGSVQIQIADAAQRAGAGLFERVLVDPPCSGLGTLQSRPDIRWRASPGAISELSALQRRILERGSQATAPGGVLVYSVCTISRAEGEQVIEDFLDAHGDFALEPADAAPAASRPLQLLPHLDGTDGFFIAKLRRA